MIREPVHPGFKVDAQNPWPGLSAFDEASEHFFAGREAESAELWRLVSGAPFAVLFGKSGLGKTSLLQAGLFPRSRQQNVLPVYVRLDMRDRSAPLIRQVAAALEAEIGRHGVDAIAPGQDESLWQYLHRRDIQWWSAKNQPLTPLFVFDQLEEAFTLGATNAEAVERLLLDLADVVENRIPTELAHSLDAGELLEQLDLRGQRYKVLLSLREDYLPDLEAWKFELPSLMRNRLRLSPLSAEAAVRVVSGATPRGNTHELVSEDTAREIVRFVAAAQAAKDNRVRRDRPATTPDAGSAKLEIEPALLSVVCVGLNEKRKALGRPTIDAALLKQTGATIIGDFYRRCVEDVPHNTQRFIEDVLITESGFRNSYPVQDALAQGWLTDGLLRLLIDRRLLRISNQLGTDRVEIIHDLLTDVVRQQRDRQRETARLRRQLRRRWIEGAVALTFAAVSFVFFTLWQGAQKAETRAREALREAVAGKLTMESRVILQGERTAPGDIPLLLAVAGYRLRPGNEALGGLQFALNAASELVKVIGLPDPVIAVSPDRATAVTIDDNGLRIWNAMTGQPRGTPLRGHTARVSSVAFSVDGRILVSGSSDSTVRLWDVSTGNPIGNALRGHAATVTSVAISRDGKLVLSGSADRTVRLWDTGTGEPRGDPLQGHTDSVLKVALSPDGTIIASGSLDKTVRLSDVATGKPTAVPLRGHAALISALEFSPNGKILATGSGDRTVRLWDVETGQPRGPPLQGHNNLVSKLSFSPDGKVIASGSADKSIRIWDTSSGKLLAEPLRGHTGAVSSIVYGADGRTLMSGGLDGSVRVWDAPTTLLSSGTSVTAGAWVLGIAISPDGKTIASGGLDNVVRFWDAATRKPSGSLLQGHTAGVSSVAFSPDGKTVASGSVDGTIRLWDFPSGKPRGAPLQGHAGAIWDVAFSPDGSVLASGGQDGTVRLWVPATGQPRGGAFPGHSGRVMSVAFSPDGNTVASAGEDNTIRMWGALSGKSLGTPVRAHTAAVSSVAFSPDGRFMVSGSYDGTLRVWDAASTQPRGRPLQGHALMVTSVAFSPDGKTVASGGGDHTLRLWDPIAGQPLGSPLEGHTAPVSTVTFSPDGKTVISGSFDTTLRFWDAPEAWLPRICAKLVRNLSHPEWTRYVGDVEYVEQCPGLPVPSD